MRVLIAAVYDQMPGTRVGAYMDLDRNRIINGEDSLLDVAHKFQQTPYRRLLVLHDEKVAGLICRRDVLEAEYRVASDAIGRARKAEAFSALKETREVGEYMDEAALTAGPNTDLLQIVQLFVNSPYRRLPIIDDGKLVGQVSRRDVLATVSDILRPHPHRQRAAPLYLSSLSDTPPGSLS